MARPLVSSVQALDFPSPSLPLALARPPHPCRSPPRGRRRVEECPLPVSAEDKLDSRAILKRSGPKISLKISCLALNRFMANSRWSISSTASVQGSGPVRSSGGWLRAPLGSRPFGRGPPRGPKPLAVSFDILCPDCYVVRRAQGDDSDEPF
jgi:hypothetical protein